MEFSFLRKLKSVTIIGNNNKMSGSIKGQKLLPEVLGLSSRILQPRVTVINKESLLIGKHKRVITQSVMR